MMVVPSMPCWADARRRLERQSAVLTARADLAPSTRNPSRPSSEKWSVALDNVYAMFGDS
jgi:hypothetical protein